jgi:hypothetical protein
VQIAFSDHWDPRTESLAQARRRLVAKATARIDAELERVVARTEALGYVFADTRPQRSKHLRWLFEHVAYGKSYGQLAREHLGSWTKASSIYNRVQPYAAELHIDLADGDPESSSRSDPARTPLGPAPGGSPVGPLPTRSPLRSKPDFPGFSPAFPRFTETGKTQ